jgi:hypothetical protein
LVKAFPKLFDEIYRKFLHLLALSAEQLLEIIPEG